MAACDHPGVPEPASRRRGLGPDRPTGRRWPTSASNHIPPRDPDYPQIVAYVAWFDHTRTALAYYPGRYEPPNAAVRGPTMVPDGQRSRLLATFNGGFTYSDGTTARATTAA